MREHNGHIWVLLSIVFRNHSVSDMEMNIFKKMTMKKKGPRGKLKNMVSIFPMQSLLHGPPIAPFAPHTHTQTLAHTCAHAHICTNLLSSPPPPPKGKQNKTKKQKGTNRYIYI